MKTYPRWTPAILPTVDGSDPAKGKMLRTGTTPGQRGAFASRLEPCVGRVEGVHEWPDEAVHRGTYRPYVPGQSLDMCLVPLVANGGRRRRLYATDDTRRDVRGDGHQCNPDSGRPRCGDDTVRIAQALPAVRASGSPSKRRAWRSCERGTVSCGARPRGHRGGTRWRPTRTVEVRPDGALAVVVVDELCDSEAEMTLPEQHELVEALGFDRSTARR
jgi:hypothetical protein